ncbi:MAG: LuxR C-terminal-related transcriptional regulator [Bacteroidales bacterium]
MASVNSQYQFPKLLLLLILSLSVPTGLVAQPSIRGHIRIDTTRWAPTAYLCLIPDFSHLHSISRKLIIQQAGISPSGDFKFDGSTLPAGDHLYRIHFSKKDDTPASLIIGGVDENHLFLVANNQSDLSVYIEPGTRLIHRVRFEGLSPNQALQEINSVIGFLDSLDQFGPDLNREFIREAVFDRLRVYADTCSHPLISLYALYQSRIDIDSSRNRSYLKQYFRKWRNEGSDYFRVFRTQMALDRPAKMLIPLMAVLTALLAGAGVPVYFRWRKRSARNPYQSLTVQERKVFGLIREGRSNKEISEICAISLSTVKSHVNSIYSKLKLTSRTDVMDYPTPP